MHAGTNARAYEDLCGRVDALMLVGGDDGLEPFLLKMEKLCEDFATQHYELPSILVKHKLKNAFTKGKCEAGYEMRRRIIQRSILDRRVAPEGKELIDIMLEECKALRELDHKYSIPLVGQN